MEAYFLFPLLVAACYKFGPLKTAAAATAFGYAGVVLLHGTPYNDFPIHFVGLFAIGIAAALLVFSSRSGWQMLSQSPVVTWICLASVFIVLAASWAHYLRGLFYIDVFVALITVAALMRMSLGRWRLLRMALESRPLAFVGGFSYSLYLIHAPLIQCVWQYLVHPLGVSKNAEFLLLVIIGTPLILAVRISSISPVSGHFFRPGAVRRSQHRAPLLQWCRSKSCANPRAWGFRRKAGINRPLTVKCPLLPSELRQDTRKVYWRGLIAN